MHNEACLEILQETDNTNNIIISFFLPASSGMVSSSPDVPDVLDVPSAKRITRFHTHVCSLPFIQCSIMDTVYLKCSKTFSITKQ